MFRHICVIIIGMALFCVYLACIAFLMCLWYAGTFLYLNALKTRFRHEKKPYTFLAYGFMLFVLCLCAYKFICFLHLLCYISVHDRHELHFIVFVVGIVLVERCNSVYKPQCVSAFNVFLSYSVVN